MTWKIQSLFSGVGGLDLGIERAVDAETVALCEFAPQNRKVLARHWPDAHLSNDVCEQAGLSSVEIVSAGFPCQNASKANPNGQAGTKGEKTGLWSETIRIIVEAQPKLVVLENVRNLLNCGFEDVAFDLDQAGYDVRWGVWTVAAVGGPHIRERLITLAVKRGFDVADIPLRAEAPANPFAQGFAELPPQTLDYRYGRDRMTDHAWEAVLSRRLYACGNAVSPVMASESLIQTLAVWNEVGGELELTKKGKLPAWGALVDGELLEVAALVKPASTKRDFGRGDWVRWHMRGSEDIFRPMVGRVHYANGDNTDIQMPGGDVDVVNTEDVKRWWPTPTAHDEKSTGCFSEYQRNSPGLPAFQGGVGDPALAEWAMGLPLGWTEVE